MKNQNSRIHKTAIILSDRSYEYDVYTLVIAFFPNVPSPVFDRRQDAPDDADLYLTVSAGEDAVRVHLQEKKPGHTSAPEPDLSAAASAASAEPEAPGAGETCAVHAFDRERAVSPKGRMDRTEVKNALKGMLYEMLCEYTGRSLPWGNLTGIRPVRLAMKFLQQEQAGQEEQPDRQEAGYGRPEAQAERPEVRSGQPQLSDSQPALSRAAADMQSAYSVSPKKADLAVRIAALEQDILRDMAPEQGYSLYVGIPFCPSICLYCSFSSGTLSVWQKEVDHYLDALIREIECCGNRAERPCFPGKKLQTVYIGGGTPTTLSPGQMDRLLCALEDSFPMESVREFTVEAGRPDTITEEKLQVLKNHHVSRISINPQTMNQKTLDLIGRQHTVEQTISAFRMARSMGFDNINMDLIVGLPGEGLSEVDRTMEEVEKLDPDDITVHALALKRAARLAMHMDEYEPVSFQASDAIMDRADETCRRLGMAPYYLYRYKNMAGNFENVGYAKKGKAGLYNILIMEEVQSILALGASGSTKIVYGDGRIDRIENVKDVRSYIDRIGEMIARKDEIR